MKKKVVVLIAIFALAAAGLYAADGAAIYKAKCASCHGPDGAGQTAMGKSLKLRDLGSAEVQKQTDKELVAWTADGKGNARLQSQDERRRDQRGGGVHPDDEEVGRGVAKIRGLAV